MFFQDKINTKVSKFKVEPDILLLGFYILKVATIAQMCREVAAEGKPEAISIFCTNLRGLSIVPEMEAELGIPIYDTIATAIWKSLKLAGIDPDRVKDRGRLFQEVS